MTFKQYIIDYSYNRGLSMADCSEVAKRVMADPNNAPMQNRWNDRMDDYPNIIQFSLRQVVDQMFHELVEANRYE